MDITYYKLADIFFKKYGYDKSKFILPKVPYVDSFGYRQAMDFAIVSQDPSIPKVAILIIPKKKKRSKEGKIALENLVRALKGQDWVPLVLTPEDLFCRSHFIVQEFEKIYTSQSSTPKAKKTKKKNPISLIGLFFGGQKALRKQAV